MGLTEVDNAPAETQDELVVEESQDINNDDNVVEEVNKEQLVNNHMRKTFWMSRMRKTLMWVNSLCFALQMSMMNSTVMLILGQ